MTYHEAIKKAKRLAKSNGYNCAVYCYKRHWWNRYKYSCGWPGTFNLQYSTHVKVLTITPDGIISQ